MLNTLLRNVAVLSLAVSPSACTSNDADTDAPVVAAAREPDAADLSNYTLDMDGMRRYATAIKGFTSLEAADTAGMPALNISQNQSTAESIKALEAHPAARRVLSGAGLTAKEYVWITAAYFQAAMTQGFLQTSPDFRVPEGQSRQNVDFLNANKADLEVLMKDAGMMQ